MTDQPAPLTDEQLNAIDARVTARRTALSGWLNCYSPLSEQEALENAEAVLKEDVPALVAEVRRSRAERDEFADRVDTLTAVAKGNKRHVQAMFLELQKAQAEIAQWRATFGADALPDALARLKRAETERDEAQAALEQIRHLHKDSPMGPCPVCIDADAAAAGGDGLVPYPCPTGRLAGAQDCDPPHVRAAAIEQPAAEACAKCKTPFDPTDTRFVDSKARYKATPFCRACVDRCHDSSDAFHRCVICDTYETGE
jgi:hypothetical protein